MFRKGLIVLVVEVGVALLLAGAVLHFRAVAQRERLERLNSEAAHDSLRVTLEGRIRIASQLLYQTQIDLGKARGRGAARVVVRVPGDTVVRVDTVAVGDGFAADTADLRDSLGVWVETAVLWTPPTARFAWDVRREPLALGLDLVCLPNGHAEATLRGPPWAAASFTDRRVDPSVCRPPATWSPFRLQVPSAFEVLLLGGGGFLLGWALSP